MKNISIKENLINLLALLVITISLITVLGFFDEGHHKIYNGFGDYLIQGGYPPAIDYIMWTIPFCLIGVLSFNLISLGFKQALFRYRFLFSFIFNPLFFLGSLVLIGIVLSF